MARDVLFKNLQALEDASFPKACEQCGSVFNNEKEYIEKTRAYKKRSGFAAVQNEQGNTYIKLVRECLCGKPILDHFGDRRDPSQQGEVRRKAFTKVIKTLIDKGLSPDQARTERLNYMSSKSSKILEKLGIFSG
jgi:uncharacterized C2H2 Zn-finger protein